ncbi:hypothetical protein [Novosphingobium sp. M1R2S20]|uniref:Uncharacterized protein n=1 Tax=Novosphingobium rhizovicinum TaxID=3228928 RepID=A0ABV3RIM8_9SPHN
MTRPVHKETDIQRATSNEAAPEEARARGFEDSDVPAGKVALGLLGLLGLLVIGLGVGWAQLTWLLGSKEPQRPPFAGVELEPPEPHLLTGPNRDLNRSHPAPVPVSEQPPGLRRAMEQVARRGWGEEGLSPPSTASVARMHREKAE